MYNGIDDPNELLDEPSQAYLPLAQAALQHYTLGPTSLTFVQHNAGIVFRVTAQATRQQYLLKLHKRVGDGEDPSEAQLEPGLHWLAAFAQASDVVVQAPIATHYGTFVAQVALSAAAPPINCTLQRWIDGHVPNGDFTLPQVQELGRFMAKLHAFSRTYPQPDRSCAMCHDPQELRRDISLLRRTLPHKLLSSRDYHTLLAAEHQIVEYMHQLGTGPDVWGPVHGDLHQDNVVLYGAEIRPIDFTGLRLAHYLYDIGVTLYYIFHQDVTIRRSFFDGYQEVLPLPDAYEQYVEAFIAQAAIGTIAWNCTIPKQMESALFQRNLQQLVQRYCASVAQGQSFLFT
jgi:Ser/Thr protein kinase RdoA (MazF antagonist)